MRMCILFPFVSGGVYGATRATRMDNHPGNPLEKHNSKRTDGTNIDLDTYLAISLRRRLKPSTLSAAAGASSPYVLTNSEAHDCVRGLIKRNFDWSVFGVYLFPFLPKVDQALTVSSTFGWSCLPSHIESFGKLRCLGNKHGSILEVSKIAGMRTGRVGDVRERAT